MAKMVIKRSNSGYYYVSTPCCRASVALSRIEFGLLNKGNSLTRHCTGCGANIVIQGKFERSHAEQTLSLL